MLERRVSRRQLLEAIAKLGPAAALAPVIAACTTGGPGQTAPPRPRRQRRPASATAAASASAAASAAVDRPSRPHADAGGRALRLQLDAYIGEKRHHGSRRSTGVKVTTTSFFSNTDEAYAKLGNDGGGLRRVVPDLGRHPGLQGEGRPAQASTSRSSRTSPTSAPTGRTRATTRATSTPCRTMWWTTGVGYDTGRIKDDLTSSKAALGPALGQAHRACSTTGRRSSAWR